MRLWKTNAFRRREKVFEALGQERRACLTSFVRGWGRVGGVPHMRRGTFSDIPICSVAEGRWCLFHSHSLHVEFLSVGVIEASSYQFFFIVPHNLSCLHNNAHHTRRIVLRTLTQFPSQQRPSPPCDSQPLFRLRIKGTEKSFQHMDSPVQHLSHTHTHGRGKWDALLQVACPLCHLHSDTQASTRVDVDLRKRTHVVAIFVGAQRA